VRPGTNDSERIDRSSLGKDTLVIGDITGQGTLEVGGRVQGNITLNGEVKVLAGATVLGHIRADSVAIAGSVRGNLSARVAIEVQGSGEIEGTLEAPRIGIETGAHVVGSVVTGPARKAAPIEKAAEKRVARPEQQAPPVAASELPPALEPIFDEEDSNLDLEGEGPASSEDSEPPALGRSDSGDGGARRRRRRRRNRRPEPDRLPNPSPVRAAPLAPSDPLGVPRIPTFQKGTHGRRRD
jgi:cytoskeletal protein CcmA (bactofilin family)